MSANCRGQAILENVRLGWLRRREQEAEMERDGRRGLGAGGSWVSGMKIIGQSWREFRVFHFLQFIFVTFDCVTLHYIGHHVTSCDFLHKISISALHRPPLKWVFPTAGHRLQIVRELSWAKLSWVQMSWVEQESFALCFAFPHPFSTCRLCLPFVFPRRQIFELIPCHSWAEGIMHHLWSKWQTR